MTQPRVLIIEDDPDQRMLYREYLGREGFDVAAVATAEEARKEMARLRPDILILDLSIDGRSGGYAFLEELRSGDATQTLPVVVVSGFPPPKQADGEPAWNHFIQKPADLPALVALLRRETARGTPTA